MTTDPTIGDRATCASCHRPIVFVGSYWDHEGDPKPRHPASPTPLFTPGPRPATTIRATIALLRPSASGEALEPLATPREFSAQDWGLIVREVNDWLRIEVTPYWLPDQLRMDVTVLAPSAHTADALRHALYGLAVAWGLQWQ